MTKSNSGRSALETIVMLCILCIVGPMACTMLGVTGVGALACAGATTAAMEELAVRDAERAKPLGPEADSPRWTEIREFCGPSHRPPERGRPPS